jgi:hypothetical protein
MGLKPINRGKVETKQKTEKICGFYFSSFNRVNDRNKTSQVGRTL